MKPYKTDIRKYQYKKLKKGKLHVTYIRILKNPVAQQMPALNDEPDLYTCGCTIDFRLLISKVNVALFGERESFHELI